MTPSAHDATELQTVVAAYESAADALRLDDEVLARRLLVAHADVRARAAADRCTLREAAYRVAVSRVAEAEAMRGLA